MGTSADHFMHRRDFLQTLPLLVTLLVTLLFATIGALAAPAPVSKLVFHVNGDTPEHQESVLRNLHNHLASVGTENLNIKVLLQGGGITLLLLPEALSRVSGLSFANASEPFRRQIDDLRDQGVIFLVSDRTLSRHHIDASRDLYGVQPRDIVPNALSSLATLQAQGYTYIKP